MHRAITVSGRFGFLRQAVAAALALGLAACAYTPRKDTAMALNPHQARVFVTQTLLHNPVTNRPARFNDYSGQILSVNIADGRIRIVTVNRTADLALADLQPRSDGPKVFLVPDLPPVITASSYGQRLADALFVLRQATIDGVAVD
jgi:hypothetical protein